MRIVSINIVIREKFIGICSEYGVSNDLTKWSNQKYFSTWQSRAWETGKPGMSYMNKITKNDLILNSTPENRL